MSGLFKPDDAHLGEPNGIAALMITGLRYFVTSAPHLRFGPIFRPPVDIVDEQAAQLYV